jgi:hypothetical protein
LNLGDSQANLGNVLAAEESVRHAAAHLAGVPAGGYREFVALGVRRLAARLSGAADAEPTA